MNKKLTLLLIFFTFTLSACSLIPQKEANKIGPVEEKKETVLLNNEMVEISEGDINLEILSPQSKAILSESKLVVLGQTSPGAEVMLNEYELIAGANGAFSQTINLEEGENYIIIVVNDEDGNFMEKELLVYYEPEE